MIQKLIFLCLLAAGPVFGQVKPKSLKQLEGRWYVIMSDFPMWTKGDKTNPVFKYTVEKRNGKTGLRDEVLYTEKGKHKSIRGFDTPRDSSDTKFRWHGKGLTRLLKSDWEIIATDTAGQWMLIHFEKTVFTPGGYDVIARSKTLPKRSADDLVAKLTALGEDPKMKKITLQLIPQT